MNSKTSIQFLRILFLVIAVFRASAQDSGYMPDLPGFPSGTYAQVAAVGAKIHGRLSAKEMDPVTGDLKRFIRMTYYGPTDTYARMGICSLYTDPKIVAGYSNPSKEDGRDVLVERRSVKYYRRDGSGGGYSLWYYKAGAVDKLFEYEFQSEDIGMPSPGAVGRPFENLSSSHRLEIQFVPKATIFTLKNEESRRPDDVMGAMLLRLEGAAGAASEEVQGIIELGSLALDPMKAVGLAQNMGYAIVHWDQTMAAIQRQVDDTANTYWESRLGLINPEDAYRKEGAFFFHVASNLTGGWVVKGAGKTVAKLAGTVDDVGTLAAKTEVTVIGRVKDLQNLGAGERSLLDRLPDFGSPKLNWKQNSGVLREEMNRGLPIRDASVGDTSGQFLNAERYLLRDRGWTFDGNTSLWMPPTP